MTSEYSYWQLADWGDYMEPTQKAY